MADPPHPPEPPEPLCPPRQDLKRIYYPTTHNKRAPSAPEYAKLTLAIVGIITVFPTQDRSPNCLLTVLESFFMYRSVPLCTLQFPVDF